VAVQYYNFLF